MVQSYTPVSQNPVLVAGAGRSDRWLGFAILYNGRYSLNADNFNQFAVSSITCTLNVWHYASITYDSSTNTGKLFIDGNQVCEGIFTFDKQYAHKSIGVTNCSLGKVFTGYLRNIRIYNDIVSGLVTYDAEIRNQGINVFPNPVSGILTIGYKDEIYKTVGVLNIQGVLFEKVNAVSPIQHLDFSKYKKGLYILEFKKNSGETCRIKVLKS